MIEMNIGLLQAVPWYYMESKNRQAISTLAAAQKWRTFLNQTDTFSDGQKMEKEMPEAGLAVIEGAGHYAFLDNPYLFYKILGSFLGIEM